MTRRVYRLCGMTRRPTVRVVFVRCRLSRLSSLRIARLVVYRTGRLPNRTRTVLLVHWVIIGVV